MKFKIPSNFKICASNEFEIFALDEQNGVHLIIIKERSNGKIYKIIIRIRGGQEFLIETRKYFGTDDEVAVLVPTKKNSSIDISKGIIIGNGPLEVDE